VILRAAQVVPGHQHCGTRSGLDPRGRPEGWLIVTRDSKISENRNEITAVREHGAKMVALNQRDAATKWGQLEVFMTRWRDIEGLIAADGPFIWRASRTAMTPIPLE
jgi:PIN like domain